MLRWNTQSQCGMSNPIFTKSRSMRSRKDSGRFGKSLCVCGTKVGDGGRRGGNVFNLQFETICFLSVSSRVVTAGRQQFFKVPSVRTTASSSSSSSAGSEIIIHIPQIGFHHREEERMKSDESEAGWLGFLSGSRAP